MLEIEKLEKEWRKYRMKRLRPWFGAIALILVAAIPGYLLYGPNLPSSPHSSAAAMSDTSFSDSEPKEPLEKNSAESAKQAYKKDDSSKQPDPSSAKVGIKPADDGSSYTKKDMDMNTSANGGLVETAQQDVVLNPDMEFMDAILTKSAPTERKSPSYTAQKRSEPATISKKSDKLSEKDGGSEKENSGKNSVLLVKSTKTNNALAYLIRRFNEKRDPGLASYIARSYYKKGEYEKAVQWSIKANTLDPSSEESWIVFAKSKAKLGQKDEAVKALKVYLNQYRSKSVKRLLKSLESGK